jgi:hypothetical protein
MQKLSYDPTSVEITLGGVALRPVVEDDLVQLDFDTPALRQQRAASVNEQVEQHNRWLDNEQKRAARRALRKKKG